MRLIKIKMALVVVCFIINVIFVVAHSRIGCPTPHRLSTDIKIGPCGSLNTNAPVTTVAPGPLTIRIEESVRHHGAPFRIALSADGDVNSACTLLDHIPANPQSRPTYNNPASYTPYYVTVEIPNVACDRCTLLLTNPMTDTARSRRGWPNCSIPATPPLQNRVCFSVYYSCADIRITGISPRSNYMCPREPPTSWPMRPPNFLPGIYTQITGRWSDDGMLLEGPGGLRVDPSFRRNCGPCSPNPMPNACQTSTTLSQTTSRPTVAPVTRLPTSVNETFSPTVVPTQRPTSTPASTSPTFQPFTHQPSGKPSGKPSMTPTYAPTSSEISELEETSSDALSTTATVVIAVTTCAVLSVLVVLIVLRRRVRPAVSDLQTHANEGFSSSITVPGIGSIAGAVTEDTNMSSA